MLTSFRCLLIFCLPGTLALGATFTVPALTGASIQSTINAAYAAGPNNTVLLPAGLYNVSSPLTLPCNNGLTLTGPVATPATAVLNATFSNNDILSLYSCNGVTIQYLQFKNTGAIYAGINNHAGITITHNQFFALPSKIGGGGASSAAIYFDGNVNTTIDHTTITWNTFGDAASCTAVFAVLTDQGGYCAGFFQQAGIFSNGTIDFNVFNHVEEGIHYHQHCDNCQRNQSVSVAQNSVIQFNYLVNWHRIAIEIQTGVTGSAPNVVSDNVLLNPLNPYYGTMFISDACCTSGRTYQTSVPPNPANTTERNLMIGNGQQDGTFWAPVIGIEYWGGAGSRANGNWAMGNFSNQIDWGFGAAPWYVQNNYLCEAHGGSYIEDEEGSVSPIIQNNTTLATCAQQTSAATTISPASGSYSSPPTVTLSNAGANTSTFYTTDGSTPTPGNGTTRLYTGPFTITLPATVKAVGMFGVAPQPVGYAAPYGFKPSAVATANYAPSGGLVLAGVALSNLGATHTLMTGATTQMTATCTYSDGSTTNCNTTDGHGNAVSAWNSSNAAVTISGSGVAAGAAAGTANLTATVAGITTPPWAMAVTTPVVSLNSVLLATTGGVTTLAAGGANQLVATCTYASGPATQCATTDTNGNVVNPWTSSAPAVATVSHTGVVTGVAAGATQLTATVAPSMTTTTWGATAYSTLGTTSPGYINATYMVLGSQVGGYSGATCSFYLPPGPLTVGSQYDCGLVPAPTPTTQGTAWQCFYTYTVSSTSSPGGWVTGPLNQCGALPAGSAWWVALVTNQPGQSVAGFYNCGSSCAGPAPTTGAGTFACSYIQTGYGVRTGMPTAMHAGCGPSTTVQAAQYVSLGQPPVVSNTVPLTVTAVAPSLTSVNVNAPGNAHSMTTGSTLQLSAHCAYSDGSSTDCTVADVHGNAVTAWSTSDGSKVTIGAVGSARPGLVTAIAAGPVTVQAFVAAAGSALYALAVNDPVVTLTGLSLATTHGVTGLFVGNSNALVATCLYSDGTSTVCTGPDSHGNTASHYVSSVPGHAAVNATTGVVTGVAPGTTTLQAQAGSVTSAAIPLTVLAVPTGTYVITISGPVKFSGAVEF